MWPALRDYVASLEPGRVPPERRERLDALSDYVRSRRPAALTFICTHNSRRSHFGQIWAAALGGARVAAFSGGTEATAFDSRAIAAIERAGFRVSREAEGVQVAWADGRGVHCFSKKYDHPSNPASSFAAIMTCTDADEACPVVAGAELRVSLPYDDPKAADGTPEEAATYDARCREIATEMAYLIGEIC